MSELRRFPDPETVARAAREYLIDRLADGVRHRGRALLALSGGSTPRRLYELLSEPTPSAVQWERVHLFWGDERLVPSDSPESNYRLVRETLLARGQVPPGNIHPVPTHTVDADVAARSYELELRKFLGESDPGFDLALLGLGADGHTASIFPGSTALEDERWVVGVTRSPQPPFCARVTGTLRLLNRSRCAVFVVTGAEKADILATALDERVPVAARVPAARVHGTDATVWFVDEAAATRTALPG